MRRAQHARGRRGCPLNGAAAAAGPRHGLFSDLRDPAHQDLAQILPTLRDRLRDKGVNTVDGPKGDPAN